VNYVDQTQNYIDLEMVLKVPHTDVLYVPGFWQVIKLAWVKYFAQFIFFYYILHNFFLKIIMNSGVFDTVRVSEIDNKERGLFK
jgi:hypothetical protein